MNDSPSRFLVAATWAALATAGCQTEPRLPAPPAAAVVVDAATVARGAVERRLVLPAEARAWQQTAVHAKVAGHVRALAVDRGDRVRAGDTLAELDVPELEADLAAARADLALARTLSGRVDRAHAKAPDLVVARSVDESAARAEVARARVERAGNLVEFATIRAPFDGVVTARFVDIGAFVPAATATADPRAAAIVSVADLSRLRIAVAVPETEAVRILPGTAARVRTGSASVDAAVSRVAWTLERDTRSMTAEIDLDNADDAIRPGMLVQVELLAQSRDGALVVPAAALAADKAGAFAFVLGLDGRLRRRAVRTGLAADSRVEILEGLDEGERVAIRRGAALADGLPFEVAEKR